MNVLELTLKKNWFDDVIAGEKKHEYREVKPYWEQRIEGKTWDAILFKNGYMGDSRSCLIEYLKTEIDTLNGVKYFDLVLGDIIQIGTLDEIKASLENVPGA